MGGEAPEGGEGEVTKQENRLMDMICWRQHGKQHRVDKAGCRTEAYTVKQIHIQDIFSFTDFTEPNIGHSFNLCCQSGYPVAWSTVGFPIQLQAGIIIYDLSTE